MAPPPLDGTLPAKTGTPDRRCLNPSAREADGSGESALGRTADSWRTAQARPRCLGADGVATPPPTAPPVGPNLAPLRRQSRDRSGLNGLLHGPALHGPRAPRP